MLTRLYLFLATAAIALAVPITINNPGFESANLSLVGNGTFSQLVPGSTIFPSGGTLDDWTVAFSATSTTAGAFNPDTSNPSNWPAAWWSGNNIGYIQVQGTGVEASLSQTLGDVLLNNSTYTLSALVGNRLFGAGSNYAIQLLAGNTLLAQAANNVVPNDDSFGMDQVVFMSGANHALAGQQLRIRLVTTGTGSATMTEDFFDDISLDVVTANPGGGGGGSPVPEPATVLIVPAALAVLAFRRR